MEDYPFPLRSELAFSFANRKETTEQSSDKRSHDIGSYDNDNDLVVLNAEDLATDEEYDTFEMIQPSVATHRLNVSCMAEDSQVRSKSSVGSYSLCGTPEDGPHSSSFSYIEGWNSDTASASSSSSTLWDCIGHSVGSTDQQSLPSSITAGAFSSLVEARDGAGIDYTISCMSSQRLEIDPPPQLSPLQTCAICLEDKPGVFRLMHKCNHPSACRSCLRAYYIHHGLKDVSNFPLRCFWPGCNKILRDAQIQPLTQLSSRNHEMHQFYHQQAAARDIKREKVRLALESVRHRQLQERHVRKFMVLQSCPDCTESTLVFPARQSTYSCRICKFPRRRVDVMSLEDIQSLVYTVGERLVNCPACSALIVKDGGCHRMTCLCGEEFSFTAARAKLGLPAA